MEARPRSVPSGGGERAGVPPWVQHAMRAMLGLLIAFWVFLVFHRSTHPVIFGRYSVVYAVCLAAIAIAILLGLLACRPRAAARIWGLRYRVAGVLAATILCFVTLELATRAYMAFKESPFYWIWGTPNASAMVRLNENGPHSNQQRGYMKYPPNTFLRQGSYAHKIPTRINNMGFRGKDWSAQKAPGTFRVICMGASSTFGYGNRDDHTYPDYLERTLNQGGDPGGMRFEVLNLGIPHMTSENILALFENEVIGYQPDVVTVYEGTNDSAFIQWEAAPGIVRSLRHLDHSISDKVLSWAILSKGLFPPLFYSREQIETFMAARADGYISRMRALWDKAKEHGIQLVLVTQQHTMLHAFARKDDLRRLTYAQEVAAFREEVEREGGTRVDGVIYLLAHARIMDGLRRMGEREGIPLVDGIVALDQRRDVLHSWVHLTEEGNELLAQAMAPTIRDLAAAHAGGGKLPGRAQPVAATR